MVASSTPLVCAMRGTATLNTHTDHAHIDSAYQLSLRIGEPAKAVGRQTLLSLAEGG
jgi:hypothetical protein